jgi:hypothetical protein
MNKLLVQAIIIPRVMTALILTPYQGIKKCPEEHVAEKAFSLLPAKAGAFWGT